VFVLRNNFEAKHENEDKCPRVSMMWIHKVSVCKFDINIGSLTLKEVKIMNMQAGF
jgi:hypothetical protein